MSVDLTKGATVELVKTLSDDLRTRDDNTKYSSAGAAMRDKANIDGYYEGLTSGTTEQIASSIYEEDNTPYTFRTAGGSIDIGDREEDTIVGGTVAWNQLNEKRFTSTGGTLTEDSNGVITYTVSTVGPYSYNNNAMVSNAPSIASGHKVLISVDVKPSKTKDIQVFFLRTSGTTDNPMLQKMCTAGTWTNISSVITVPVGSYGRAQVAFNCTSATGASVGDVEQFKNFMMFDLTQMFGPTIADYIYSLGQATAGAGVAWFKKLFPKPYYAYNAGTLKSVEGLQSHDMVGFNAWDEEWEAYEGNRIRSKNFCNILPNTTYFATCGKSDGGSQNKYYLNIIFYDADKNVISNVWANNLTFTTPSNAVYFKLTTNSSTVVYGNVYHNDICINLHWDGERDGEYEPYEEHVYDLDSSLTLRGIPKLDENNNLYYDGDVYNADGTVERKYGILDMGTLPWAYSGIEGNRYFSASTTISNMLIDRNNRTFVCAKYVTVAPTLTADLLDKQLCKTINNNTAIFVKDSSYTDAATFKTAMSGVYLVYELATPTTETAQPYAQNQTVNDFGTEEYVSETNMIPVGHETKYQANLKAKLEMAPDSPSDNGDYMVRHTNGQNAYVRLDTILANKANTSGTYDDIVSGGSKQLVSTIYEEDNEPYLFRTSGGSIDIGDREDDTIVGGTVAFNQQMPIVSKASATGLNGVDVTNNNDGSFTLNGTATGETANYWFLGVYSASDVAVFTFLKGHKYYVSDVAINYPTTDNAGQYAGAGNTYVAEGGYIGTATNDDLKVRAIRLAKFRTGATYSNKKIYPVIFDLTQMFGSTIADYIYSLETATAGAGVAWFRKLFNKPYYEYDAGTLKSVEGLQSHDMVGFNAWDEEWEVGAYNPNGTPSTVTDRIRGKHHIKTIGGQSYYLNIPSNAYIFVNFYDANDSPLQDVFYQKTKGVVIAPYNSSYMLFYMSASYGTTYNHDICINLHWDGERDGEYEPYVKHSYPLDSSLVLRGIFKLDENNKLRCDGDVYEADGTVTRKYGVVDLGTLTWVKSDTPNSNWRFYASLTDIIANPSGGTLVPNMMCTKYVTESPNGTYLGRTGISNNINNLKQIMLCDMNYSDAASLKTALNGVYCVYELATPTTEESEPYQTPQIVDDFGTEEYVTDSIVPVGHNTKYMPNLKAKLEMAPDSPSDNGDYIVRHTDGQNEYVPLVIPTELPTMPTDNGTYHLKVTVSNGTATLAWESES